MADQYDSPDEKVSSTHLLPVFLGIAVLCGIFFALGYMMRRNPAPPATAASEPAPAPAPTTAIPKPSAVRANAAAPETAGQTAKSEPTVASADPAPRAVVAPEIKAGTDFVVQVAAVSKPEDADALVNALRKKNYPVFVMANEPVDKLFHVQVGPFRDSNEAQQTRARLASDGYNAIVKK